VRGGRGDGAKAFSVTMESKPDGCGCPPTAPAVPSIGGVHHVFLTVNDLKRSRAFYAQLMPRLGYPAVWEYPGSEDSVGFLGNGGSLWLKQAPARFVGETFSKDRVGLCELAFRAEGREQVDALAHDVESFGGAILDPPRDYPEYVPGYYAVFFTDPDGIKLELVYIPG
jgi:catechol 2,3-dioxygenase-like lactoylglutathione lyase family enzyme